MPENNFNFEAAFEKLGGRMDVLTEKFSTIDVKIENTQKLFHSELVPIKADIETLKQDSVHCEAARKTIDQSFARQVRDLDAKIAINPVDRQALEARLQQHEKRTEDLERHDGERKAVNKVLLGGLSLAWAAILGLITAWVSHAGIFGH